MRGTKRKYWVYFVRHVTTRADVTDLRVFNPNNQQVAATLQHASIRHPCIIFTINLEKHIKIYWKSGFIFNFRLISAVNFLYKYEQYDSDLLLNLIFSYLVNLVIMSCCLTNHPVKVFPCHKKKHETAVNGGAWMCTTSFISLGCTDGRFPTWWRGTKGHLTDNEPLLSSHLLSDGPDRCHH